MSLLRDPDDCGFLRRFARVYREKRRLVPVREAQQYVWQSSGMRLVYRRMPRWAAFQIAWHQANQARTRG
jgi:hypothetical protein